ncbi:MarR family winged helix-turn-helix transcriptional regulator [Amycolatopsis sp. NPDC059027]|uniref:MarR family winged helix-turn-helix transcriptional regulator n=1 Tax=unclassified Amycolatopsis TaxID=2618356 RepID=UPI00366EEBB5
MGSTTEGEDVRLELVRELRAAALIQHAWIIQAWKTQPDLHPAAVMLLSDLAKSGEARPSELAKRRFVDLSVISRQVAQLREAGLIDRRPAPDDGRATLISVSERGHAELGRWRATYLEFMKNALDEWDEERITTLTTGLAELNDALRTTLGAPGGCFAAADKEKVSKE